MASRRGGFLSGFIIGGLVGAAVAYIVSQKSDQDTVRGRFADLVARGRDTIREAVEEGKASAARKEAEYQSQAEEKD